MLELIHQEASRLNLELNRAEYRGQALRLLLARIGQITGAVEGNGAGHSVAKLQCLRGKRA